MLWLKFRLLLWKNWIIQKRHPWQTSLEVVFPLLCTSVLVLLRFSVRVLNFPEDWHFQPVKIDSLDALRTSSQKPIDFRIAYSPRNDVLDAFISSVAVDLKLDGFVAADDADELQRILLNDHYVVGIEFEPDQKIYTSGLPKQLSYALRFPGELRTHHSLNPILFNWQTDKSITAFQEPGPRCRYDANGGIPPGYDVEGFLPVQNAIARCFMRIHSPNDNSETESDARAMPEIFVRRFPYPGFRMDMLITGLETILPLILVVSFIYPCINLTKVIALEKERQLKETMQIMGLPGWLHWAGWSVRAMPTLTASAALIVIVLKVHWGDDVGGSALLAFSHWSVVAVFLFLYCLTTMAFCFMMSVFFSKANIAAGIAGFVWFGLFLVYQFVQLDQIGLGGGLALCLLSNTAMAFGVALMLRFEAAGQGSQWWNLFEKYSTENELRLGYVMLMMLVTTVLYVVIAMYVERVWPGEFGVPKSWYFPLLREFWWPNKYSDRKRTNGDDGDVLSDTFDDPNFEKNHDHVAGVRIRNLRKSFGNFNAVHAMTLDMYVDEITIMLGHNGAGKTTTMSMLTGMMTASAGTAYVNGYDIRYEMDDVRHSLGLCPQHNVLFDDLTVSEHIEFFMRLKMDKNCQADLLTSEITRYMKLIGLEEQSDCRVATLSGGMKRKLAVCLAFCGGSKVVFCDEPSSGMDPAARRSLWEFIRQEKHGRTVLLSTHHMDEADVLADRIAILNAGSLKCCGSPYFLKKRFGLGYHLLCTKSSAATVSELYGRDRLTSVLQEFHPSVMLEYENSSEMSFMLPDTMQKDFERLFRDLEDRGSDYGLCSFGLSLTTLEDVFMKVGRENVPTESTNEDASIFDGCSMYASINTLTHMDNTDRRLLTGIRLWRSQLLALLRKRYLQTIRNWLQHSIQSAIPIVFVIAAILIDRARRYTGDLPRLPIDLDMYDVSETFLQMNPIVENAFVLRFESEYIDLFRSTEGSERHTVQLINESMESHLLRLSQQQLAQVNRRNYVAAHMSPNASHATAWFNNQPYHAVPLAVSLVHSAIIRAQLGSQYSIRVTNAPLPYSNETHVTLLAQVSRLGALLGQNITFAMGFVMAFYAISLVREQANRAKLLQFVSGARTLVYWASIWLWDLGTVVVASCVLMLVIAAFGEPGWSTVPELSRILLALVAFGFAALPLTYICCRPFAVPAAAYTVLTIAYVFTGIVLPITVSALVKYDNAALADALTWVFRLWPHFALSSCLSDVQAIETRRQLCDVMCGADPNCASEATTACALNSSCCEFTYFTMQQPGMGTPLVYMLGVGVLSMVVNVLVELRWFKVGWWYVWQMLPKCLWCVGQSSGRMDEDGGDSRDADVVAEEQRVRAMPMDELRTHSLVVRDLTKTYGRRKRMPAVERISVAVDGGECFGLLGTNGAGKTSTFKMLIGERHATSGEAWVRGISLRTHAPLAHRIIGYCPQFDALCDELTCRETLQLFGRLRGIRSEHIDGVVGRLAVELDFVAHLDKPLRACSGGNRRKLSTAVALIGQPVVVYLDEPTAGMDPGAKRRLWNVVIRERHAGTAFMLTSHSMDECEALCTRLAVMVRGMFQCLGSVQHLKSKFARGYQLQLKVTEGSGELAMQLVERMVHEHFAGALLENKFHCLLSFYVPNDPTRKWSTMFGILNAALQRLPIEDYALSQTSLEQVFLLFAQQTVSDKSR